jgi:hypothetical protein
MELSPAHRPAIEGMARYQIFGGISAAELDEQIAQAGLDALLKK